MKKLFSTILVLGLLLSGCSENKSESNRKKSTIKLSCVMKKAHVVKKFDGTDVDIWIDEKYLKENLSELVRPIIIEIFDKGSHASWIDTQPNLLHSHNEQGFSYMNESNTSGQGKGLINLHYISVDYKNLKFINEMSLLIKNDDSKYEFGFQNKAKISTIGYGSCDRLK